MEIKVRDHPPENGWESPDVNFEVEEFRLFNFFSRRVWVARIRTNPIPTRRAGRPLSALASMVGTQYDYMTELV